MIIPGDYAQTADWLAEYVSENGFQVNEIEATRQLAEWVSARPLARIVVMEREGSDDDFETESGRGFPEDLEPEPVDSATITVGELEGSTLEDAIQRALDGFGCGQWDGGSVGYDPDGSHLSMDGTRTERYAVVSVIE